MESEIISEDVDGCIHSIHVRNFFCHENLEVNLNPNVNFIVGRNGSGKSAILTALVVGLGGRASATNRGNNLGSFIKKGANSATVEIKIKNSSTKAYKHEVYGDYITIVRTLHASGASNYKVKSATGEVISTKFEEVNSIILAHDIQVDNPISVLNQDDARSFHASDAKKKYSLFRKATNLDQTEVNYLRALDNCKKAESLWNRKNEACLELEKEYKKWRKSHEQLQSRDEIEFKKQALQDEYYWSEITELESDANTIQTQYDKQMARVGQLVEKLREMERNYDNNNIISALKTQIDKKTLEKTSLEQEFHDLENEVRDIQAGYRSTQNSVSKFSELLNRERRKVYEIEMEINNIESGSVLQRREEAKARAAAARAAAAMTHARYDTAQHDAQQARANVAHAHSRADQAQARVQRQRDSLKQLKQQVRELEARGADSLAVYGARVPDLCQRVARAVDRGVFSAPPRGPVGAYLKVKEKKWGGALEYIIGGSIQTFCVNSPEDSRNLFKIMAEVYGSSPKPGVTCSKFLSSQHNVRNNTVRAGPFISALDSLEISDPVIANFLIDNVGLERILLVPNHDDAMRLTSQSENVPSNCARVVTLDGSEYHPAPNYRSYGGAARAARYLHLSTVERKRQLLSEIKEGEATLRSLEEEAERLNAEANDARDIERTASRNVQALLAERHEKDEADKVAAAALDQQQAPHHAVLVDELNISKEKVIKLTEQLEEYSSKERQYRENIDKHDTQMKKIKAKLKELTDACRSLSEEIDQEHMRRDQGISEQQTYKQRVREDRIMLTQVEQILEDKRAIIAKKIDEALKLCPRVENPRDKMTVMKELKQTQLKLSSLRNDGMTKAQVAEKLLEVEKKYRRTQQTLTRLKLLIDDIKQTSDRHLKFCHHVQTLIARQVQLCFQSMLKVRGYSGSMTIDNGRGELELAVSGRDCAERRRAASTSSLSGGERSYSTVAFIMALWDCVELPFYFMDEFDVFMDNVNRKAVMQLLIDHALNNSSRQFVFLTPQDTSNVTAESRVSIHLMADPRA